MPEVIAICLNPECLAGITDAGRWQCRLCASVVKPLAHPVPVDQFTGMTAEEKQDLKLMPSLRAKNKAA